MSVMSPRERVFRSFRHEVTDRMPRTLDVGASNGIDVTYIDTFRANTGAEDPAEYFDYDIRVVTAPLRGGAEDFSAYYESLPSGTTFDELGVAHAPAEDYPLGHVFSPWGSFTSPRQIDEYPVPTFESGDDLEDRVRALHERGYAVCAPSGSINEYCYYLRGMEAFLTDLLVNPKMAQAALGWVTAVSEYIGLRYCQAGVDILCFYGDMGDQRSLLMSPKMWRQWIMPCWERVFTSMRRVNPDVFIFYHSCGYVEPIIPGLIELGVDVLNPIQPEAMDPIRIKREYGDEIALWGGIGMQQTMLSPDPEVVRQEARRVTEEWTKGGGAIVTVAQTILPDVPWDNVVTLLETVEEYSQNG